MRIATWDIETTDLAAVGSGFILTAVVKPLGEKPKVFRYDKLGDKPGKEVNLIHSLITELSLYDMLVGHNQERFDWPFLKSRAYRAGIMPSFYPFSFDTMVVFRRCGLKTTDNGFGKPTARLDHVADFLGIKQQKTHILPSEHWKTVWEDGEDRERAMSELVKHNVADVQMTEQVYLRLLPYARNLKRLQ